MGGGGGGTPSPEPSAHARGGPMQPSSGHQQRQLPAAAMSAELGRLEAEVGQAAAPLPARARLPDLGEAAEVRVLRRRAWEQRHAVRGLSADININAPGLGLPRAVNAARQEERICEDNDIQLEVQIPGQQIPCRQQNEERTTGSVVADLMDVDGEEAEGSPRGWILVSPDGLQNHQSSSSTVYSSVSNRERAKAGHLDEFQMPNDPAPLSPVSDIAMRVQQLDGLSGRLGVATPPSLPNGNALSASPSPQMLALGELEFDRRFLIFVYLADKKIDEVLDDVSYIRYLKSLPMDSFESEIWNKFGKKSVPAAERRKNLDWDSSKTRLYYCNVEIRDDSLVTSFEGPYVDNKRTYLQNIVGDGNILIVKFADIPGLRNSADNFGVLCMLYRQVAEDGILLGLRRYRFFIHKYGGKEKQCYFIRTESGWDKDEPYFFSGYTINQARRCFMHIHSAPTVSKYLARFSLILSKTITADVNLSEVSVMIIEDEPCKDEHGNIVTNDDGEPLIHTYGTGLISFDLAVKCPTNVFSGNVLKAHEHELQDTVDSEGHRYLIQYIHMFYNGNAVKGTLLADKRLPDKTIHIRPSMIKVKADSNSLRGQAFNSLEVVTTSNRPKKAMTSRVLIALLHYGGVPAQYFMDILGKAPEDVYKDHHNVRNSLEVAINHSDMDDFMSARMILAGIQPEDEAFLQFQLALMTKEERKHIQHGKILIDDCCYLMGTADPTGTLKPDEVCVIHDNHQVSGKVLVYKHPGLHFGDIHKLTATHIDGLEEIVGNSKYAIFFPTSGSRSLADEMAGSDFDGDMFWVSWNPQLVEHFKPSKPWEQRIQVKKTKQENPQDYDGPELESLLFCDFLRSRFLPSYVHGTAANCWLTLMDRLLTPEVSVSEKDSIKIKMLELVDIYYLALDAPRTGNEIEIPEYLMVKEYAHFLEQKPSYHSTSLLGKIYDQSKMHQSETVPPIKIALLKCFTEEAVPEYYKCRWTSLHHKYLIESASIRELRDKEERMVRLRELHQQYKRILYHAEDFEASPRSRLELFNEACAIYQVVYARAMVSNEVSKCGFAWKVAGRALCELYLLKRGGGETVTCRRSVLENALKHRA